MTKEEAKNRFDNFGHSFTLDEARQDIHILFDKIYDAHEASDKTKDERIAELEAMVEKMKCCGNCNNTEFDGGFGTCCSFDDLRCEGLSHWQLKGNR
jgi:hypothetical protein